MNRTTIEWCHRPETGGASGAFTWNPIRARVKPEHISNPAYRPTHSGTFCTRVSPGCTNCYASVINKRFGNGLEYTVPNLEKVEFFLDYKILAEPVGRKKPATIFVGDMFDLFHESIPAEFIAEVLRIALKTPRHTYQFLTKRATRMRQLVDRAQEHWGVTFGHHMWFGVSVEDEKRRDERIPQLQMMRAAVRFLSIEPQLEDVPLLCESPELGIMSYLHGFNGCDPVIPGIDWVICGGESGPGARPFNLAWAESMLLYCKISGTPFFMKQLGSNAQVHSCRDQSCTHPDCGMEAIKLRDRKGGDPEEWPQGLRVRQFPSLKRAEVAA